MESLLSYSYVPAEFLGSNVDLTVIVRQEPA